MSTSASPTSCPPSTAALSAIFAPHRVDQTIREIEAAQLPAAAPAQPDIPAPDTGAVIADCDAKLARYQATLDAGGDPQAVARWTRQVEADRAAALARDAAQARHQPGRRLTADNIRALITSLGDLRDVIRDATPAENTAIYDQLGLKVTFKPRTSDIPPQTASSAARRPGRHRAAVWGTGVFGKLQSAGGFAPPSSQSQQEANLAASAFGLMLQPRLHRHPGIRPEQARPDNVRVRAGQPHTRRRSHGQQHWHNRHDDAPRKGMDRTRCHAASDHCGRMPTLRTGPNVPTWGPGTPALPDGWVCPADVRHRRTRPTRKGCAMAEGSAHETEADTELADLSEGSLTTLRTSPESALSHSVQRILLEGKTTSEQSTTASPHINPKRRGMQPEVSRTVRAPKTVSPYANWAEAPACV